MSYRVFWRIKDLQILDIADFLAWKTGVEGAPGTTAFDQINALLKHDTIHAGESREGNERLLFVDRCSALFEVYESQTTVVIYSIKYKF